MQVRMIYFCVKRTNPESGVNVEFSFIRIELDRKEPENARFS
jgi:hypothetical protein